MEDLSILLVTGSIALACAAFAWWLIANRRRLDDIGRAKRNTYISAGYRAAVMITIGSVNALLFVLTLYRQ